MSIYSSTDYWLEHAKAVILSTYGDNISYADKNKDLLKFGRNKLVQTTKSTIMTLPTGIYNEPYVSTNIINSIISTSAADTQIVTVEGHTISGGVFTFVVQSITLTGQTVVALTTALARVSRVYNTGSTDLAGTISVTQTDTYTAGVPNTAALVHLQIEAGLNNSEKAATTVSNTDYWIVTSFYSDCLEKTATYGVIHFEVRTAGGVFINKIDISTSDTTRGEHEFKPYLIIPKNADVRLRASASTNNKDFSGGMQGILASVI